MYDLAFRVNLLFQLHTIGSCRVGLVIIRRIAVKKHIIWNTKRMRVLNQCTHAKAAKLP
jgi:hypothetical protein